LQDASLVVMGRIAVPYGVRGWVKLQPFTQVPGALAGYGEWWVEGGGSGQHERYRVVEARVHGSSVVAKLEGIESREQAATLNGATVSIPRDAMPAIEDDEVYVSDLVGLEVVTQGGESLGRVIEVQEFGAHPVMRVAAEGSGDRLIPFVPAHVRVVDLEAGRIEVDWQADY
jgi:16S rRNA processing protein RimM